MNLDLDIIQAMTISAAAVVPIIVAVCQVFKMTGWIQDKYTPFLSLAVGVAITFLLADDIRTDLGGTVLTGILFGLAASGLYSGVKSSAHAIRADKHNNDNRNKNKNNF